MNWETSGKEQVSTLGLGGAAPQVPDPTSPLWPLENSPLVFPTQERPFCRLDCLSSHLFSRLSFIL